MGLFTRPGAIGTPMGDNPQLQIPEDREQSLSVSCYDQSKKFMIRESNKVFRN